MDRGKLAEVRSVTAGRALPEVAGRDAGASGWMSVAVRLVGSADPRAVPMEIVGEARREQRVDKARGVDPLGSDPRVVWRVALSGWA